MSEIEIRERVATYITESADDMFLRMIYAMMQEYEGSRVIKPMTQAELESRIDEAEEDIQEGRVYSTEEMRSYFSKKQA